MPKRTQKSRNWWHGSVFYHIYPRSFCDSNNDGVGDLPGITSKLGYLKKLGVNAIWLSPFYPSPMADFGYDVSDYVNVDPQFGNLADFKQLVKHAHSRNIKLIVDFVPNHTSSKHDWFTESKSSKASPKRDWYIWRKSSELGQPPNNWISVFGGPAWEYDNNTGEYYLHTFLKEQPDLNWANAEVRQTMISNMKFWLGLGVDGFRVDAVSWLSKDSRFRDEPLNPNYADGIDDPYKKLIHSFSTEGDFLFDYLNEMVAACAEFGAKFMITEAYPETDDEISHYLKYYEMLDHGLCAPFNFECISFPWDAATYRGFIDLFQEALLPGQPPIYNMGNHDRSRMGSRIGRDAARSAAVLLLTLPGIPFIYYGDEIGMIDVNIPPTRIRDPLIGPDGQGRDQPRSPMQWNDSIHAGFSKAEPWLPVADDYKLFNVEGQLKDPGSFLSLYRVLLRLRKGSPALKFGTYRSLNVGHDCFGFVREFDLERYTIIINFKNQPMDIGSRAIKGRLILSSYGDKQTSTVNGSLKLRPHEAIVLAAHYY